MKKMSETFSAEVYIRLNHAACVTGLICKIRSVSGTRRKTGSGYKRTCFKKILPHLKRFDIRI